MDYIRKIIPQRLTPARDSSDPIAFLLTWAGSLWALYAACNQIYSILYAFMAKY